MEKLNRKWYIQNMRIISMIAVVFNHIGSTAITDFPEFEDSAGGVLFGSIVNLMHFAVPCFFMISGALLLDPQKEMPVKKVLGKAYRYVLAIGIFGWGYAFAEELFHTKEFSAKAVCDSFIRMVHGDTWAHMWYLYELVGVTLCIPIMRAMIRSFSDEERKYIICIGMVFLSIVPMLGSWSGSGFGISLAMGNIYCFYMLLGYWIDQGIIRFSQKIINAALFANIPLQVLVSYLRHSKAINLALNSYSSPAIIVYSAAIFMIAKNNDKEAVSKGTKKIMDLLEEVSFGVYLLHMFWINLFFKLFNINPYFPNPVTGLLAMGTFVLVLSLFSSALLRKVPLLKKIL